MDDAEHMPFYILFGVIVAAMLAGIFIMQYNRQLEARVDEQAQALANDLARISFTAFSREQPSFLLPRNLGGSDYELSVYENKTFVVHIKAGRQSGMSYYSTANVSLSEDNFNPVSGGSVYFQRRGDNVVVSSSPITAPPENLLPPVTATPPEFYNFAKVKENAKAATAIAAAYFFVLENFVHENKPIKDDNNNPLDVLGYGQDENVQIGYRGGDKLFGVKVSFEYVNYESTENIGKVGNAWIVTGLTILKENLTGTIVNLSVENISVENAYASGWLYSPAEALAYLRSRTWMSGDNLVVVPAYALENTRAAAATTNVSTYLTYRVTFDNYVIYYRAMPWWAQENSPGFVFQSDPKLEAL